MKTFITNFHSRREMLVANCIAYELSGSIEIFEPINIYDIYLSENDNFIVISDSDMSDMFISKFINDILNGSVKDKNNKIIFLHKNESSIKHKNIISIPYDAFYHYNEYINLTTKDAGYILCELNCVSQKKNGAIQSILYPENTDIPVRLVNCPRFDHPQNLGIVNDYDMLKLISECSLYIGLTDNYIYDAISMKKPTITTASNKILPVIKSVTMEDIRQLKYDDSYLTQLKQNKISNIIKYKLK